MTGTTVGWVRWPAGILALLAIQFLAWTEFVLRPVAVSGPSMEPTLLEGDLVLVDLWTYRQRAPRRGEVVWIATRGPTPTFLVKRVGRAQATHAMGVADSRPGATAWVLGDNPAESLDSRQFGEVSADRVAGRVLLRYWPPSRLGVVR